MQKSSFLGVSENEMSEVLGGLPDDGDEIPLEKINQIMEQFGINNDGNRSLQMK